MTSAAPLPGVSAGAPSRPRTVVIVLALGIALALGCAVVVFALRGAEDPESTRLMVLGGIPSALVAAVVTALALTGFPVTARAAAGGAGGLVLAAGLPCAVAITVQDGYAEGLGSALLFALLLVPLAELIGILVGMIVLWPVAVVLHALTRRRGRTSPRVLLVMILLLLVAVSGVTAMLALDTHGWAPGRGSGPAMLGVVFGLPIEDVTVRSVPMLWATRAIVVVMAGCVVALLGIERSEERARREPRAGQGRRPRGNRYRGPAE